MLEQGPVLLVRDGFLHGNPTRPLDDGWIETSRRHVSGLIGRDVQVQLYDRIVQSDPMFCHAQFLDRVGELRPAFVWYRPKVAPPLIHRNLRAEVLYTARALYGTRLVVGCGGLANPSAALYLAAYASISDLAVAVDGGGERLRDLAPEAAVLDLWPVADGSVFRDAGRERTVDVCIVGEIDDHPDGRAMASALGSLGISVGSVSAGDADPSEIVRRAEMLNRARLALCLPRPTEAGGGIRLHLEAILCGALPLDREGGVLARHAVPYRHYVPFGEVSDFAAKVRRYLGNEPGRRSAVTAAQSHLGSTMSDRAWWLRILETLNHMA